MSMELPEFDAFDFERASDVAKLLLAAPDDHVATVISFIARSYMTAREKAGLSQGAVILVGVILDHGADPTATDEDDHLIEALVAVQNRDSYEPEAVLLHNGLAELLHKTFSEEPDEA